MSKKIPLVGLAEAAELAGVSRQAVWNWKKKYPSFPEPVAELKVGPIWMKKDIVDWLEKRANAKDVLKSVANQAPPKG